jgi:hypothetical protein
VAAEVEAGSFQPEAQEAELGDFAAASLAAADGEEPVAAFVGFLSELAAAFPPGLVRQGLGYRVGERDLPERGLAVLLLVLLEGPKALLGHAVAEAVVEGG